jgi:hypothetical protein
MFHVLYVINICIICSTYKQYTISYGDTSYIVNKIR